MVHSGGGVTLIFSYIRRHIRIFVVKLLNFEIIRGGGGGSEIK